MLTSTEPAPAPRHPGPDTPWPMVSAVDLGTQPAWVPVARHYARAQLAEWSHLAALATSAEAVVCELVTNAVVHGEPPATLSFFADSLHLLVEAWDASSRPPVPREFTDESGAGLGVVRGLSRDWGWYPMPDDGGKVVWAWLSIQGGLW